MTAISLGQAACLSQPGRTAVTAAKVGRFSRGNPAQSRPPFEMHVGNVTSRPQEFASGFVDFLLGRGARHPR